MLITSSTQGHSQILAISLTYFVWMINSKHDVKYIKMGMLPLQNELIIYDIILDSCNRIL